MRGELDWIVMKSLEKDRNRRYETADAFGADVHHYLNDEPVLACPPSVRYRLCKFACRNRAALAIATTMVVTVLAAAGGIGWLILDRSAREARLNYSVALALQDAGLARDRVWTLTDNPFRWEAALAEALLPWRIIFS